MESPVNTARSSVRVKVSPLWLASRRDQMAASGVKDVSDSMAANGKFTEAKSINDLLGGWAQSEAHAGAGKSADAQALTKGEISLALTGKGHGVDIGFAFGKFTIEKQ